tara:strand:- start:371 stop:829 length:459 start_codon:yes stop_codon:yes gene_type:complete
MSVTRNYDDDEKTLEEEFRNLRKQNPEEKRRREEQERRKREKKRLLLNGGIFLTAVGALKAMKELGHEAKHIAKGTTHVCPAKQFPRAVQTQRTCPNTLQGELEEYKKMIGNIESVKDILENLEKKAKDAKQLTEKKLDRRIRLIKQVAKGT